ncbi:MAG: threonine synthase [Pseudomonadales bacterium]
MFELNLTGERPNFVTHLECGATGEKLPADQVHNLSPAGKPILVRYDLDALRRALDRDELDRRPADLWRYRELLPVRRSSDIVSLGEAQTPIVRLASAPGRLVYVKDEGRLPTGSFKARGLCVGVSMAKSFAITKVAMPSNGNAGAALAAYGARAGMDITVFCPRDTPEINIRETEFHGARVEHVDGYIDDCGRLVAEGREREGWFDMSTLKEPYRIEGKKTMGLELAQQMGWALPDVIFYPTGGGTGLIGMWKAFHELAHLGWVSGPLPRMVAVQACGCAPIVRAFESGAAHAERWENAATVAAGIRVPAAIGDFLILEALHASDGFAMSVDDDAILSARDRVARSDGLLLCPEGAATYAAYEQALGDGRVASDERVMLFNCATGLKYPL